MRPELPRVSVGLDGTVNLFHRTADAAEEIRKAAKMAKKIAEATEAPKVQP